MHGVSAHQPLIWQVGCAQEEATSGDEAGGATEAGVTLITLVLTRAQQKQAWRVTLTLTLTLALTLALT